jgi:hypothetical protein
VTTQAELPVKAGIVSWQSESATVEVPFNCSFLATAAATVIQLQPCGAPQKELPSSFLKTWPTAL